MASSIQRSIQRVLLAASISTAVLSLPGVAMAHPSADVAKRAGLAQIKKAADKSAPKGYGSKVNRVGAEVKHRRTAFGGYLRTISKTGARQFCPVQVDVGAGGGVVAWRTYECHTPAAADRVVAVTSGAKWKLAPKVG